MKQASGAPARDLSFVYAVAALAVAAVVTHARSFSAPFFADDWLFLDQVRYRSLGHVLGSPDPIGNYFRPLGRQVWFWLLARVGGEGAFAFHLANLCCLVGSVVLLAVLARRLAGPLAGIVAAGFLALHYAADVPVLWVSGSQELLSLTFALAALAVYERGRRAFAAALYFGALLSKEVVVLLPIVALALDGAGGPWRVRVRRAWPLAVALVAWIAIVAWAVARRGGAGAGLSITAAGPVAAVVLLVRVALGLEWQTGALPFTRFTDPGPAALAAIAAAGLAVLSMTPARPSPRAKGDVASARGARTQKRERRARDAAAPAPPPSADASAAPAAAESARATLRPAAGVRAGLLWALAGALPVAVVANLWSAYYFLFAIAGAGLAIGSLLALRQAPAWLASAIVVVAGFASTQARGLEEFATAPSAWSGQSHVNRFYLERGMHVITRGLEDLREQIPHPKPGTTFFFAGLPPFAAFQVGDGPLVRGAYRDSSLHGHYLSELTRERLERGPWAVFFFDMETGRLVDRSRDPGVFVSSALGQMMNDRLDVAAAALDAAGMVGEDLQTRAYLSALVAWGRGDTTRAKEWFTQLPRGLGRGGGEAVDVCRRLIVARDTLAAVVAVRRALLDNVLNSDLHAVLSQILMTRNETLAEGELEAFAARVLNPESAAAWRLWALVLARENRQRESIAALDRYLKLRPEAARDDPEALRLRAVQVRMLPGGDIAQRSLKKELQR
ncbi:MAG TPA: hypothetical protein VN896_10045 [Methylomirabilota bacterium]|nr:hypothetical protein [Methylomirabilota bacterium]